MDTYQNPMHEIGIDKTDSKHATAIDETGQVVDKSAARKAENPVHGLQVDKTGSR